MSKIFILLISLLLVACHNNDKYYNGYIDAELIYLSSDFGGRLDKLAVTKGQSVKAGQLIFKLEQVDENFKVAISKLNKIDILARQRELQNRINYAQINYNRIIELRTRDAASNDELDQAKENLNILQNQQRGLDAQMASNKKDIAQKIWQLRQKQNTAPESGIIFDNYFNPQEYVSGGIPIVSLITAQNIKVIFFVAERELSQVYLGQKILIQSDGALRELVGQISYISNQAEYTPPIIFSREDRQKLVFRIEAKMTNPNLAQIHLGQPVSVKLVP